jgi:hypothetical protein
MTGIEEKGNIACREPLDRLSDRLTVQAQSTIAAVNAGESAAPIVLAARNALCGTSWKVGMMPTMAGK